MPSDASSRKSQLYITNLQIDCPPADEGRAELDDLKLIIVDERAYALNLLRTSRSSWKPKDEAPVPIPRHGVMLVAASDGFGDLSRADFDISHLFRRKPESEGAGQRNRISLSLKPVEEAPKLTFSYEALNSSTAGLPETGQVDHPLELLLDYYPRKPDMLISYGDQFLRRFNNLTQSEDDIKMTMKAYQDAVDLLSANDPRLATFINDQGLAYFDRYSILGRVEDLHEAMNKYRIAMAITPEDHEYYPRWLNNLGNGFLMLSLRNGNLEDLSNAIETHRRAVQLIPDGYVHLPFMLNNLGNTLLSRFEHTGELEDLSESIQLHQRAVMLTPNDSAGLPTMLTNLSHSFIRRFERNGDLADLSESIRVQQLAIQLTPSGHARLPSMLSSLGHVFNRRYYRTRELDDISEAIRFHQQAVQMTPEGHPDLPVMLDNLGDALRIRYVRTGKLDDIQEAIQVGKKAIELTPEGHPRLHSMYSLLALALSRRFERTEQLDDVQQSVEFQRKALQVTPAQHISFPLMLSNLGTVIDRRFQQTGDLADINEAIQLHQQSVELTADDHANLPSYLHSLGQAFSLRFRRTGNPVDISQAIELHRRAIKLTPEGHEELVPRLSGLGDALRSRFEQTGELIDISEAIRLHQRALQLTPDDSGDFATLLNNLGNSFTDRFEQSRDPLDISEAIQLHQQALKATPEGHQRLPARLSSLGSAFCYRFEQAGDLSDIEESIRIHQLAIQLTPAGDAQLPLRLNNLGHALFRRFEETKSLADLSQSIELHQQSVDLMPEDHQRLPACLNNLGNSFLMRFSRTRELADNTESIKLRERVIHLLPDGHPDLPDMLYNLGNAFFLRFLQTQEPEAFTSAMSKFTECALSSNGSPMTGILACQRLTSFSKAIKSRPASISNVLAAQERIIHLLSLHTSLKETLKRRHKLLVDSSKLSTAAAATALSVNHPTKAVEWLEQGRCIIWNQINQLRLPLDELRMCEPALADRFTTLSKQLENASARTDLRNNGQQLSLAIRISLQNEAHDHLRVAQERDAVLESIRRIRGFEDFLRPRKFADLVGKIPKEGWVVILNADQSRCDALILSADCKEPVHIPLERISYDRAAELSKLLRGHLASRQLRSRYSEEVQSSALARSAFKYKPRNVEDEIQKVLRVLWVDLVEPILQSLPDVKAESDSSNLPHIWWCPTGPFAFLPIHAAGIYGNKKSLRSSLGDFAISSYIPNLSTFDKLRYPASSLTNSKVLFISQPATPGLSRIPSTSKEVDKARGQLDQRGISSTLYQGSEATVAAITNSLEHFSSLHLACHASQNVGDSLESAIHLHDGPLKLSAIIQKSLPGAELAFLSACQTSTGDENLPEEAVHLAAGMLAAGYRGVVATMWSIFDKHAP